ncbi:MAG: hypothetical protein Q9195_006264 [Heterodermia aff. obscurata]
MSGSALVGQPPKSQDDYNIIKGLLRVMGVPDAVANPSKGLPLPLMRPPNDHYPSGYPDQGPRLVAAILITYGALPAVPRCMNGNTVGIALSIVHIAFDFVLLSVPLIVLWKIKMSATKKLRVSFLFSIGAISCIGSVMRQIAQYRVFADTTWNLDLINWTTVDIFFAITAASLPVLNAIIPQRWRASTHSLPHLSSFLSRDSREGHRNQRSMVIGSEDTFRAPAHFSRTYHMDMHAGIALSYDSQETIQANGSNTRFDGTEVVPKLDFRREASLEDDCDIEKYTYPRRSPGASFESTWDSLELPREAHRPRT